MTRKAKPVSFSLDPVEDADIRRWLDSIPAGERSERIRRALRAHIRRETSLSDVMEAVNRLERKIGNGAIAPPQSNEEPSEAASALDALANL